MSSYRPQTLGRSKTGEPGDVLVDLPALFGVDRMDEGYGLVTGVKALGERLGGTVKLMDSARPTLAVARQLDNAVSMPVKKLTRAAALAFHPTGRYDQT